MISKFLENDVCPESHPYAYSDGKYCCSTAFEKTYSPQGTKCDGGPISFESTCCKDDLYSICPVNVCKSRIKI